MKSYRKTIKKVLLIVLATLIAVYMVMLLDTNSVMRYAKSVFNGEISEEEVIDTPLYIRYYPKSPEIAKTDSKIRRIFVAHDFVDGYMWVKYDLVRINSAGEEFSGSWDVLSRWKIHRENGEWKVVEIEEAP